MDKIKSRPVFFLFDNGIQFYVNQSDFYGLFKLLINQLIYDEFTNMNFSVSPATWLEGANIHLVCVATWIIAAVWSSFPLFGWGEYVPEPYGISCTVAWRHYHTSMTDAVYVICSFACFVLVPVLLIVVSQCKILLKIYRFSRTLSTEGFHINLRRAEKHLSVVRHSREKSLQYSAVYSN